MYARDTGCTVASQLLSFEYAPAGCGLSHHSLIGAESDANETAALTFFPRICRPALLSPPRSATSFSLGLTIDRGKVDTADDKCSCKGFASIAVVQHSSNTQMTNTVVDTCIVCSSFLRYHALPFKNSKPLPNKPCTPTLDTTRFGVSQYKYDHNRHIFIEQISFHSSLVAASLTRFCPESVQR